MGRGFESLTAHHFFFAPETISLLASRLTHIIRDRMIGLLLFRSLGGDGFMMQVLMHGGDEPFEQGVGPVGLALKFGMELAGDVERVILDFDHFHEFAVR